MTVRSRPPMGMGPCRFCLRDNVPLTREHVFARWLVARLHAARVTWTGGAAVGAGPTRIADLVTVVCGECNAGWMSGLEVSFRQAVFAPSRPDHLAEPTRRVLSRWFTKTGVLVADAIGRELIPGSRWTDLMTSMPADVRVGITRLRRPRQPLGLALGYVF